CDISPFSYTHYYSFHLPRSPRSTLFPYTTLFRSLQTGPAPSLRHRRSPPESRPGGDKRSKPGKWEPHLRPPRPISSMPPAFHSRSEEHTSELQSRENLVCRLLLEKKKNNMKDKKW